MGHANHGDCWAVAKSFLLDAERQRERDRERDRERERERRCFDEREVNTGFIPGWVIDRNVARHHATVLVRRVRRTTIAAFRSRRRTARAAIRCWSTTERPTPGTRRARRGRARMRSTPSRACPSRPFHTDARRALLGGVDRAWCPRASVYGGQTVESHRGQTSVGLPEPPERRRRARTLRTPRGRRGRPCTRRTTGGGGLRSCPKKATQKKWTSVARRIKKKGETLVIWTWRGRAPPGL
jgi:hypothetical protein